MNYFKLCRNREEKKVVHAFPTKRCRNLRDQQGDGKAIPGEVRDSYAEHGIKRHAHSDYVRFERAHEKQSEHRANLRFLVFARLLGKTIISGASAANVEVQSVATGATVHLLHIKSVQRGRNHQ
jgi:hypothetical protein